MNTRLRLLALLLIAATAGGKDITLSNDPVSIALPLNREIRIEFPEAVIDLNVPAAVGERLQTLLKPNGALFWKATGQISNSRAIATTAAGDVILLDLHTTPSARDDETVYRLLTPAMTQVVQAQNASPAQAARQAGLPDFLVAELMGGKGMDSGGGVTLTDNAPQYDYTDMAAFAMQHYLGPARLISNLGSQGQKRLHRQTSAARLAGQGAAEGARQLALSGAIHHRRAGA